MPSADYAPFGVFVIPQYGKYQHRFKVDMDGELLWPLCRSRIEWFRSRSRYQSAYTPMCPTCEERFRQAGWRPLGEGRPA